MLLYISLKAILVRRSAFRSKGFVTRKKGITFHKNPVGTVRPCDDVSASVQRYGVALTSIRRRVGPVCLLWRLPIIYQ